MTKTTWAEMIVIGGVLSKYDKSENNNMDEMHTPCEEKKLFMDGLPNIQNISMDLMRKHSNITKL